MNWKNHLWVPNNCLKSVGLFKGEGNFGVWKLSSYPHFKLVQMKLMVVNSL